MCTVYGTHSRNVCSGVVVNVIVELTTAENSENIALQKRIIKHTIYSWVTQNITKSEVFPRRHRHHSTHTHTRYVY